MVLTCNLSTFDRSILSILAWETTRLKLISGFKMAVQLKILYADRCKKQTVDKEILCHSDFDVFVDLVREIVGSYMSGMKTPRLQYRDDEGTFVTMLDKSDLDDALACLSLVPNTEQVFRMCLKVTDQDTPVGKEKHLKEIPAQISDSARRK